MQVSIVVAFDRNQVIGRAGGLPWHISEDLKHFKAITMGKPIIMGRKTHESIGRPLPGRTNVVVSRDPAYRAEGCVTAVSINDALSVAGEVEEIMIVGGASLYQASLALANKLYLTEIHADVGGDVVFPQFDRSRWREVERSDHDASAAQPYAFSFVMLEKKSAAP